MNREEVEKRTILLGIVGSQAYRINTATSDIDLKGIAVAKKRHYLGFETFEQKDQGWHSEPGNIEAINNSADVCVYELKKYLHLAALNNQHLTRASNDFIRLLHISQAYRTALREYDNYQSWKKNRNVTRAESERQVGYDVKHAAHLIRLLRMGIEILTTGEVIVNREKAGDAPQLKAIRNCEYSYEQLKTLADELFAEIEAVYPKSVLPKYVDRARINDICVELVEMQGWK